MFTQFIEGRVTDADRLRHQYQRWLTELAPQAAGWLGSTGGITPDGTGFIAVRFASTDDARANSNRPEQGEWWKDTEACFGGPVEFLDCDETQSFLGGGSDDAGFVQVIRGRVRDLTRARDVMADMDAQLRTERPDVIGGYIGTRPDGTYVQVVYFTSEEDARRGEASAGAPEEFQDMQADPPRFLDLSDPWLASASAG